MLLAFTNGTLTVKSYGLQNQAEDSLAYEDTSKPVSEEDDPFGDAKKKQFSLRLECLQDFTASVKQPILFEGNTVEQPVVLRSGSQTLLLAATVFKQQ